MLLYLKGVSMGGADVIPGVSGGTVAFITGIYEELVNTIPISRYANMGSVCLCDYRCHCANTDHSKFSSGQSGLNEPCEEFEIGVRGQWSIVSSTNTFPLTNDY